MTTIAAVWTRMQKWIAAKTGLWRLNARAWNREAGQLEGLAAEMTGVSGLEASAGRLRERAANLRRWAQEEAPS